MCSVASASGRRASRWHAFEVTAALPLRDCGLQHIMHDQVPEILNSGRAPTDPRESAVIANLPAGNYTAIVRGVSNTTGVALVEVYDLQ